MRKYYLDNLRSLSILLLFPLHTFMIWNEFGTKFYIWGGENKILSTLIVLVNPWLMPLLFVIAGISARYALERRTIKVFLRERFHKLLLPFLGGLIFLVPIQTYFARKFFYDYQGGFFKNIVYFFTHLTNFSGYDGCFTPGHLWFILFLFLISMLALLIGRFVEDEMIKSIVEKSHILFIIGLFLPVSLFYYLGNFGGFSLGKSFALYLLGYYVLYNDDVIDKLEKNWKIVLGLNLVSITTLLILYYNYSYYGDLMVNFVGWISILSLLILGKKYLNRKGKFSAVFGRISYPVYIFHQSILVALGYYVMQALGVLLLRLVIIMSGSFLLTILCVEIVRRIPYVRNLFGMTTR